MESTQWCWRSWRKGSSRQFTSSPANWGVPTWLEVSECDTLLCDGQEGRYRELQACQSDLGARKGHGAHHRTGTWQPGDQIRMGLWKASPVLTSWFPLQPGDPLSGCGKGCGYCLFRLQRGNLYCFSLPPPGETSCSWLRKIHCWLGKNLAGWPGPKVCHEQS